MTAEVAKYDRSSMHEMDTPCEARIKKYEERLDDYRYQGAVLMQQKQRLEARKNMISTLKDRYNFQ